MLHDDESRERERNRVRHQFLSKNSHCGLRRRTRDGKIKKDRLLPDEAFSIAGLDELIEEMDR